MAARGTHARAIAVHDWWLKKAREHLARNPRGLVQLGIDLAKRVKREQPFDHGDLSKFMGGQALPTEELAEALRLEFRLPPHVIIPRSEEEATHLESEAEKMGGPLTALFVRDVKLAEPDERNPRPRRARGPRGRSVGVTGLAGIASGSNEEQERKPRG